MLDTQSIYFVYVLFDWLGVPRYVGKGKGKRHRSHVVKSDPKNQLKNEFIEQTWIMLEEIPTVFVREQLAEAEAFSVEKVLIRTIGRIINSTGPLTNITEGGDGVSGFKHSKATKEILARTNNKLTAEQRHERQRRAWVTRILNNPNAKPFGTAEQHREAGRRGALVLAKRPAEQRRASAQKGADKLTPEEQSAKIKRGAETLGPKGRRTKALKSAATLGVEGRRAKAIKANASLTAEERQNRQQRAADGQSSEKHSENSRKSHANTSDDARVRKLAGIINRTTEQKREAALKAWETRRSS